MKPTTIRRNLYKVLRKTGVPREKIVEDASLREEVLVDEIDMTCFLFLLETKFHVEIDNKEMEHINSIESTIEYLQKHCA